MCCHSSCRDYFNGDDTSGHVKKVYGLVFAASSEKHGVNPALLGTISKEDYRRFIEKDRRTFPAVLNSMAFQFRFPVRVADKFLPTIESDGVSRIGWCPAWLNGLLTQLHIRFCGKAICLFAIGHMPIHNSSRLTVLPASEAKHGQWSVHSELVADHNTGK